MHGAGGGPPRGMAHPAYRHGMRTREWVPTVILDGSTFKDFELICGRHGFIRWGDNYWLTASKHTMSGVWSIHLKCRESLLSRNDRFWIAARGRGCRTATVRYEPRAAGLKSLPSLMQQTERAG